MLGWALLALACSPAPITLSTDTDGDGSSTTSGSSTTEDPPLTVSSVTLDPDSTSDTTDTTPMTTSVDSSSGDDGTTTNGVVACESGTCAVDMVFVVDNTFSMAEEQAQLAQSLSLLETQLRGLELDVQVLFTTTDFGNPLCTPFRPEGYDPAAGAPVTRACTDRLSDFTSLTGSTTVPEVCTDVCPSAVEPIDDPFVAFNGESDNVSDVPDVDIDGDGIPDSAAAQALACIAPMGINGCGYESQLEDMLQALNPGAAWNGGPRPFLRPEASIVAIAILTDEADCSVANYAIMDDPQYQETNPDNGSAMASSAICWNAGVECSGLDAAGVYQGGCQSVAEQNLQPTSRYINYLVDDLRNDQGKEVVMLGLVGVPPVTEHAAEPPYTPTQGGVEDLDYRNWAEGQFPGGDIVPDEFAMGVTAPDKQFQFGIGPGCTGQNAQGEFTGQAIPPVRLREVCEALDVGTEPTDRRCCLESVCGSDYAPAMTCFSGLIENLVGG